MLLHPSSTTSAIGVAELGSRCEWMKAASPLSQSSGFMLVSANAPPNTPTPYLKASKSGLNGDVQYQWAQLNTISRKSAFEPCFRDES